MRGRYWIYILLLLIPALIPTTAEGTEEPFFPLAEIRPGMKGQCYTVVKGEKIDSFPVEIIGILKGTGSVRHLILIKFSGKLPDERWGIAAGMSGSPVFVGNRLVGAVGYGFENADPRYGLVTPIAEMLKLWDEPPVVAGETFLFQHGGLAGYKGVVFGGEDAGDSYLHARPVVTPLLLSDANPRAYRFLAGLLPESLVLPVAGGLGLQEEEKKEEIVFQPGSALALMLVDGDYQAAALGTVTWVEDGRFLAFGHPFLNRGVVEYGAGEAFIHDIIASEIMPFKVGSTYPMNSRVVRDRGAGIAGELGTPPATVEVTVAVLDKDTGREEEYSFRVVQDEFLLQGLVQAGIISLVDKALDRIGPGTATVRFQVEGENFPFVPRENLFYGEDVAAVSLNEIGRFLRLLVENEFVRAEIEKIAVKLEVTSQRLSARLVRVELPKTEFFPGEEFVMSGIVLPFRGTETEIPMKIKIPEDFSPGKWVLSVQGSSYTMAMEKQEEELTEEIPVDFYEEEEGILKSITSLEEMIEEFLDQSANNELVVETYPLYPPEDPGADFYNQGFSSSYGEIWTVPTHYYLTGEEQVVIEVIEEKNAVNGKKEVTTGTGTKHQVTR